jgi:FlaA1/EpsC-like NDP-sugar epimerase
MGASKRVGEMIIQNASNTSRGFYCAVRFGNVLGSSGSVVPLFREQIAAGGPVTVTHPEVRRFFMTLDEAVGLVLRAAYGNHGPLCVLDMGEQIRILELARHMITMAGYTPDIDIPIVFSGLRPGEKLFEEVMTEDEEQTRRVNDKILVADSSPMSADFQTNLDAVVRAGESGDDGLIRDLMTKIVPTFQTLPPASVRPPGEHKEQGHTP